MTTPTPEDLDKLMAEKVMGWKLSDKIGENLWEISPFTDRPYWHPTTDMNQAMQCVETFDSDPWDFTINRGPTGDYFVEFTCYRKGIEVSSRNKSAPLAICQAIWEACNG